VEMGRVLEQRRGFMGLKYVLGWGISLLGWNNLPNVF
jgi:hypothetical protein